MTKSKIESTFPAIFFAAIIDVIVFIAVSHVSLDSPTSELANSNANAAIAAWLARLGCAAQWFSRNAPPMGIKNNKKT